MTTETPARRVDARDVTDEDMLAVADPELDPELFDQGPVYQNRDVLRGMPEGMSGKFYIPKESDGDGLLAAQGIEGNPLGPEANHQLVNVYDCAGRPVPVQRAKLRYYLLKMCPEHSGQRAFTRNPRVEPPIPTIPCKAKWKPCHKLFDTERARDDHFRLRHASEFQSSEREAQRLRDERSIAAQERTAAIMERLLLGDTAPAVVATAEAGETVNAASPDETWTRPQIMKWLKETGRWEQSMFTATKDDLLAVVGR